MPTRARPKDHELASFCWRYDTEEVEQVYKLSQTKLAELGANAAGAAVFPRTDVRLGNYNGAGWRDWVASVEATNVDQVTALQRLVATCRIRLGYELPPVSRDAPVAALPANDGSGAPANSPTSPARPDVLADIRLVKRHNSGLYGVVWSGVQVSLNRNVAVKFIKPSMGDSATVLDHARSLARVNHRNVVTIHQVGRVIHPETSQAADCIIMEWLEGEQLGARLNGLKFTSAEALSVCLAILDGVAAIHAKGIVHGDLHAGNVLLTPGGVKIIDIAYDDSHSLARLTTSSRDRHVGGDVEFVRYLVLRILLHSEILLPSVMPYEPRLRNAHTLEDVQLVMRDVEAEVKEQPNVAGQSRTEELDDVDEAIIGMAEDERGYLLTLSRPRNQQGVPVNYFDSFLTRELSAYSEMIDSFVSRQLMRIQGRVYALTRAGYRTTDRMWRVRILQQLSALQRTEYNYVETPVLAEKVGLTDGEAEAAELQRLLKELEAAGQIESVQSDGPIMDVRLTLGGRAFLRSYATVAMKPMD